MSIVDVEGGPAGAAPGAVHPRATIGPRGRRRAGDDRPRILVGTVEVAGTIPDFADGLRRLGCRVTTAVRDRHWTRPDLAYDVDLGLPIRWPAAIAAGRSPLVRLPRTAANRVAAAARLLRIIDQHDVFLFQWGGSSLTYGNGEFPLLKRLGKTIISFLSGSDVRYMPAYCQQYDALCRSPEFVSDRADQVEVAPDLQMRSLRMAERYSDLIYSVPNQSSLAVRPYMHYFVPINLGDYRCEVPARAVPVVVHAPSHRTVKGTGPILAALERLRDEGVAFELRLLEGLPNHRVVRELEEADVAVDQLYLPLHGKFGVEAMATGCALATSNRQDYEPFPAERPIWSIDWAGLDGQLRRLLTDRDLRVRLAREGRRYVERYHDHVAVARRCIEHLRAGPDARYDYHPRFCAAEYRPPAGATIPRDIQKMTARIVQRWGLPEGVDPREMIARGLMSADGPGRAVTIPRWPARAETRGGPPGSGLSPDPPDGPRGGQGPSP